MFIISETPVLINGKECYIGSKKDKQYGGRNRRLVLYAVANPKGPYYVAVCALTIPVEWTDKMAENEMVVIMENQQLPHFKTNPVNVIDILKQANLFQSIVSENTRSINGKKTALVRLKMKL